MIIANIEPLMKEIQEGKDKSIFDSDVSMCFVLSVLEKYLREAPKVEIDIPSIEARYDHEVVVHCSNYDARYEALEDIYSDIMNAMKKLEDPA